jgi:hypothetical protein
MPAMHLGRIEFPREIAGRHQPARDVGGLKQ